MNTEELQKLIDAAEPEDRMSIVQSYMLENKLVFKMRSTATEGTIPRHIVGLGTSSATIQSSADRVSKDQKIRLAYSPLPGGPYSMSGYEVIGNGTLAQPVVAQISGLAPNTQYFFVIQVVNKDGSIFNKSEEESFTTLSHGAHVKPVIDVRMTTAEISGSVNHIGVLEKVQLFYAEDGEDYKAVGTDTATITGLKPNTVYNYFLQVLSETGIVLDESPVRSFTTLDYVAISSVSSTMVTSADLVTIVDFVPSSQSVVLMVKRAIKNADWNVVFSSSGNNTRSQRIQCRAKGLDHSSSYVVKSQVTQGINVLYESEEVKFKTGSFDLLIVPDQVLAATANILGFARLVEPEYDLRLSLGDRTETIQGKQVDKQSVIIEAENMTPDIEHIARLEVLKGEEILDYLELPFKTEPHNPESIDIVNIKDRTATLIGTADYVQRNGFARFAWGRSSGKYDGFSPLMFGDTAVGQKFAYMAFGLNPDTDYCFTVQLIATDGVTVTDQSQELFFTTAKVIRRKA